MEDRSKIDAKAKKASATMGTDFGNPETHKKVLAGAASDGERAVEVAKKDLEKLMVWWNKKEWTMEERFDPPPSKVGQIYRACIRASIMRSCFDIVESTRHKSE